MAIAVAVWSLALTPGKPESISPPSDIRITNAALGAELADESGRSTVKLIFRPPRANGGDDDEDEEDDETEVTETVLCSLTPGKIEQSTLDIILEEEEEFVLEVVGKNVIHLTGNYIDQSPTNPMDFDSEPDTDEEGAFDLRDVSSDVEIDPEELDSDEGRFEEVEESAPASSLKRPRDSMDVDQAADTPAKADKKSAKKLKAEGGKPVTAEVKEVNPDAKPEDEKKDKKKKKDKKNKKTDDAVEGGKEKETQELAGGVQIKDVKVGTGPQAKKGNTVSMRYIGKLSNKTVFDKNTAGKPFKFRLGAGEVIKGWDEGIVGMQVGGERLLVIPPSMAYGNKKSGAIPPKSTLTFEVKLLEIK